MQRQYPLPPDARTVVRQLLESFNDLETLLFRWHELALPLSQFSLPLVGRELAQALTDAAGLPRVMAAVTLLKLDQESPHELEPRHVQEAAKVLAAVVATTEGDDRVLAVTLMGAAGFVPRGCVKLIKRMLHDEDAYHQTVAALALIAAEEIDSTVVTVVGQALRSEEVILRTLGAMAAPRLGVRMDEAVQGLLQALEVRDPFLQIVTIGALGEMGAVARRAVPTLLETLNSSDVPVDVRAYIPQALERIGYDDEAVEASLIETLWTGNWEAIDHTVGCLTANNRTLPERAARILIARLDDQDPNVRYIAAWTLPLAGQHAVLAVPALLQRVVNDTDRAVLEAAIMALAGVGRMAVPALLAELKKLDPRAAPFLRNVLLKIGCAALEDMLAGVLEENDPGIRRELALALDMMGPLVVPIVPRLIELIENTEGPLRCDLVIGLAAVGPDGSAAAPLLTRLLSNKDSETANWAAIGLVSMGAQVLPLLEALSAQADVALRPRLEWIFKRVAPQTQIARLPSRAPLENEPLLEFFAVVGEILTDRGPTSSRRLAQLLAERKAAGTLPASVQTSPRYVLKKMAELEAALSEKEGQSVRLFSREANRKGGLTARGRAFLAEVDQYFGRRA